MLWYLQTDWQKRRRGMPGISGLWGNSLALSTTGLVNLLIFPIKYATLGEK